MRIFLLPEICSLPRIVIFPVAGSVETEIQIEWGQFEVSATAGEKPTPVINNAASTEPRRHLISLLIPLIVNFNFWIVLRGAEIVDNSKFIQRVNYKNQ